VYEVRYLDSTQLAGSAPLAAGAPADPAGPGNVFGGRRRVTIAAPLCPRQAHRDRCARVFSSVRPQADRPDPHRPGPLGRYRGARPSSAAVARPQGRLCPASRRARPRRVAGLGVRQAPQLAVDHRGSPLNRARHTTPSRQADSTRPASMIGAPSAKRRVMSSPAAALPAAGRCAEERRCAPYLSPGAVTHREQEPPGDPQALC
jgi:hypothetical protein